MSHLFGRDSRPWLAIAVVSAFAVACSPPAKVTGSSTPSAGVPAPGTMVPVSVDALPPINFIKNGGFEEWAPGSAAPANFAAALKEYSTLEPVIESVPEGKKAVRQTWTANDGALSFWRQFHTVVDNLSPNTTYRLSVRAKNPTTSTVVISASKIEPGGTPGGDAPITKIANVITVSPGKDYQEYTGTFTVPGDQPTSVLFNVTCVSDNRTFPISIEWDDWRLNRE